MKTKLLPFLLVSTWLVGACGFLLSGCGTFTVAPGSRPEVVYAEASAEKAAALFDSFVTWERRNEAALLELNPDIHATANEIRRSGIGWIRELRAATKLYKEHPTGENLNALKVAQELLDFACGLLRERMAEGGK